MLRRNRRTPNKAIERGSKDIAYHHRIPKLSGRIVVGVACVVCSVCSVSPLSNIYDFRHHAGNTVGGCWFFQTLEFVIASLVVSERHLLVCL